MTKYTHLVERCSGFLRTGVAWRLKRHGYTFSETYWRLRDGKGLISLYDKESLKLWSDLITCVRRCTGALTPLSVEDQARLKKKRNELLECMECFRDRIEMGTVPQYLYEGFSPAILEHVLADMVGDVRGLSVAEQERIWTELDMESVKAEVKRIQRDIDIYKNKCCKKKFIKDKVWQIRTGHDTRSSVNAEINKKLVFIWEIPSLTGPGQRAIFDNNKTLLENYKKWKEENKGVHVDYDTVLLKVHMLLDSIIIPD